MTDGEPMTTGREGDRVRAAGSILVAVGVAMWIVYAVGRYVLGWQITDRGFLPYHLATILPGMALRYHRLLFEDLPRRWSGRERGSAGAGAAGASTGRSAGAWPVLVEMIRRASTASWASFVAVVALLERDARHLDGSAALAVHSVARTFFWLAVACLPIAVATWAIGRGRAMRGESARDAAGIEEEILRVRDVYFVIAFAGGTYFAYLCAFREWLR